ncbi:MAG: hypothetical protein J5657_01330 [Clostridiales bacterium]|nr:hypothetical protein [Clostridiales bacterium]
MHNESHYREVLSDIADHMDSYFGRKTYVLASCHGLNRPTPRDFGDWAYVFSDFFLLVVTDEVPVFDQEDIFFGKGNESICVRTGPDSPVGKTIYVKEKEYAFDLLSMLEERFYDEDAVKMEYEKLYASDYLCLDFYFYAI